MLKQKNIYLSDYNHIPAIAEYCKLLSLDKSIHTIMSYITAIDRFFDFIKVETTDDIFKITSFLCREYQAKLKNDGLKESSVNAHIRNLKALFNWLIENDYIKENPFNKIKNLREPKTEKPYMSRKEIDQFLAACKNLQEKCMFAIFLQMGIRREELASIRMDDVDGDAIKIRGKGKKERSLAMPSDAYEYYLDHMKARNRKYGNSCPYVFVSKMSKKYSGQSISKKFKAIMKRAGFSEKREKELHLHSTRHTYLANFLGDGNDIRMAQSIMGHSQLATTANIYSHLRNDAVLDAMRNQKRL